MKTLSDPAMERRFAPAGNAELLAAIQRFPALRIAVVGDFILDRFVRGTIDRISPEAPVPVLHGRGEALALGGAGNVVANVVSLGGKAVPLTAVGDDMAGRTILAMLEKAGVDCTGMFRSPERMTSSKSRFSALNQQVLRFDEEEVRPLSAADREVLLSHFRRLVAEVDVVVLSDYGKGVLLDGVAAELIATARASSKPVIVDPKGRDFARYAGATVVTPNRKELGEAVGRSIASDEEVTAAARELIGSHGFDFLLATRSEKGMSVVSADAALHIPAWAREVFDVSGAGDTVVATFALGLAAALERSEAAVVANAAAGVVVAKHGTAQLTPDELVSELFRSEASAHSQRSIVELSTAEQIVAAWRRQGQSIAFTNGCFDVLHAGHVSLIQQARATADRLVLGLNSDGSVRRLKGELRPFNPQQERATVLAALAAVDLVVIFEEDTPLKLIGRLKPDVLVKGADYTVETVVGADIVKAAGGRVVLAELTPGKSTTDTIRQMTMAADKGQ